MQGQLATFAHMFSSSDTLACLATPFRARLVRFAQVAIGSLIRGAAYAGVQPSYTCRFMQAANGCKIVSTRLWQLNLHNIVPRSISFHQGACPKNAETVNLGYLRGPVSSAVVWFGSRQSSRCAAARSEIDDFWSNDLNDTSWGSTPAEFDSFDADSTASDEPLPEFEVSSKNM